MDNKTIVWRSREKKKNHITIIAEIEKENETIVSREIKKALRCMKRLLKKETSFLIVINQDNNQKGEQQNQSSRFRTRSKKQ